MKIQFKINKYGGYNYKIHEKIGFELPKCRHCGMILEVDNLKREGAWLFCNNYSQDHEDDALMQYTNGEVEYLGKKPMVFGD